MEKTASMNDGQWRHWQEEEEGGEEQLHPIPP
jgi:hypothetical protein